MEYLVGVGCDLVRARRALGVTQAELGLRVGVSQPQIARWEAIEYRTASLERVEAVAAALDTQLTTECSSPVAARAPEPGDALFARLGVDRRAIAGFCSRHGIVEFGVFGSVVRPGFGPESDIDVLVRFEAGRHPGFGDLEAMSAVLASAFGRPVHLVERSSVERSENDLGRRAILSALRNLYAA